VVTAPKRIPINNKLCRLLGYYAAEGHSIDRIGISLNSKTEQNIAIEIRDEINSIFSNLTVVDYHPNPSELQLRFGGTLTARIFKELCGRGSKNKKAPDFIFQCSTEKILEFVGAYLTGDGWFEGGKIRAKSTSKKLINDLIYLLLQAGIIAKYDGIRVAKERKAPQGTLFKESISHVLRIQGIKDVETLMPFLRGKIKNDVESYLKTTRVIWSAPPHGLPVRELNIKNSLNEYNWRIEKILRSSTRNHINPNLIKDEEIKNQFLRDVINGDVAFDLVKEIVESDYSGEVYDLSVPGPQNFLGGFGGIFLHNSAHAGRDDLFKFVDEVNPQKVICLHGDNCECFAKELGEKGFDAIAPKNGDSVDI
jgi:DNA polymerase I